MNKFSSNFPDFLIIGAGKSGTTSLDKYLSQHPQIFMSPIKEPNFFAFETIEVENIEDENERNYILNSVTKLDDYLNLFSEAQRGQIIGETSNTYMYHAIAATRIQYYNPEMKLIAVLRNPAERLYSRYLHLARDNRLPSKEFRDALDKNSIWWQRNDLIPEGFYYKNLRRFFNTFPPENIKIFLYEDFKYDSERMLTELFEFLDVNSAFKPNQSVSYNKGGMIKNQFVNKLVGNGGFITNTVKKLAPGLFKKLKDNYFINKGIYKIRNRNLAVPSLDAEIKNSLIKNVYQDDILNLQQLIDRDLSHWVER